MTMKLYHGPLKVAQKVVVVLLCCVLVLQWFPPVKAKAVATEAAAVSAGYAALASYLQAGGIFLVVEEGGAAAATAGVAAAAEAACAAGAVEGCATGSAAAAAVAGGLTISPAGVIILTAAAAAVCGAIAAYLITNSVPAEGDTALVLSNSVLGDLRLATVENKGNNIVNITSVGSPFTAVGDRVHIANGIYLVLDAVGGGAQFRFRDAEGNIVRAKTSYSGTWLSDYYFLAYHANNGNIEVSSEHPIYVYYNQYTGFAFIGYYPKVSSYCTSLRYGSFSNSSTWFLPDLIEGLTAVAISAHKVKISNPSGAKEVPQPAEKKYLALNVGAPAGITLEELEPFVMGQVLAGTLTAAPSVVGSSDGSSTPPVAPPTDYDPPTEELPEEPTEPENPGTDVPYLPSGLVVPWHYVVEMLGYAAPLLSAVIVCFNTVLPSSVLSCVWAAVVLLLVFSLLRRFLG